MTRRWISQTRYSFGVYYDEYMINERLGFSGLVYEPINVESNTFMVYQYNPTVNFYGSFKMK